MLFLSVETGNKKRAGTEQAQDRQLDTTIERYRKRKRYNSSPFIPQRGKVKRQGKGHEQAAINARWETLSY
jgi:hypothetical protein